MNKREVKDLIEVYEARLKRKLAEQAEAIEGPIRKECESMAKTGETELETAYDLFIRHLKKQGFEFRESEYHWTESRRHLQCSLEYSSKDHKALQKKLDGICETNEKRKQKFLSQFKKVATEVEEEIILDGIGPDVKKKLEFLGKFLERATLPQT